MDKLFEKSIKNEKAKLKNLLDKLKASTKASKEYNTYYKQKNTIVDSLYKSGVKSIIWNKKTYSLGDDINRRKQTSSVVKYDQYNKNLLILSDNLKEYGSKDINTDISKVRNLITGDVKEIKTLLPSVEQLLKNINMKEDFSNVGLTYKEIKHMYDNISGSETGDEDVEIKKVYNQLDEEKREEFKKKLKDTLNRIYKFFKANNQKGPKKPTETETNLQDKSVKSGEPGVQPETKKITPYGSRAYKLNDIVTIKTKSHNINAVYMGVVGEDVQDILNKINNFEKSDPFDGVFVMVRNTAPDIFTKANIDILLFNENLVGQEQTVKGYLSDGILKKLFKVTINSVTLMESRNVEKIAASKIHNIEGTLLEKINSKEFKEYMKAFNEKINIMTFESKTGSDFIEINENYMGKKDDVVQISPKGKGDMKEFILEKPDGSAMINMFFSDEEEARKYIKKKGLEEYKKGEN